MLSRMDAAWNTFVRGCRDRYGVGAARDAVDAGVAETTFYRRTEAEGWNMPYAGVRVAPWARPTRLTELSALLHAAGDGAMASGETAAWLRGLSQEPRRLQIAIPHGLRVPKGANGLVRRCRWLEQQDGGTARGLPTLAPAAMFVTLAAGDPLELRGRLIDALHRDVVTLPELASRLAAVGPVPGRRSLSRLIFQLGDRQVESLFHDLVLDELTARGYRPDRSPRPIATPDGRGVTIDIPLPDWRIAIETHGDRFHRSRDQRSADRRKATQYAGTEWLPIEVDWWEWMGNRKHFLEALDAAIMQQVARNVGGGLPPPPHLRGPIARVHQPPPGAAATADGPPRTR